jgi:hypothetical protein
MVELTHAFSRMIAPSGVWHDQFDKSDTQNAVTDSPPPNPESLETYPFVDNGMAYVPLDSREIPAIYAYFKRQSIFWDLKQAMDWCRMAGRQAPTDAQFQTPEAVAFQARIQKWSGWFKFSCESEERGVRPDEVPPLSPELLKLIDTEYEAAKEQILRASNGTPAALRALLTETESAVKASNEQADKIVEGIVVDNIVEGATGHVRPSFEELRAEEEAVRRAEEAATGLPRSRTPSPSKGKNGGKPHTRRRRPATAKRTRRKAYNKKSNKRKSSKKLSRRRQSRRK